MRNNQIYRGVTRTILGGFTKRNVSLGGSGGMLPQKNFENHNSMSVNSCLFLISRQLLSRPIVERRFIFSLCKALTERFVSQVVIGRVPTRCSN